MSGVRRVASSTTLDTDLLDMRLLDDRHGVGVRLRRSPGSDHLPLVKEPTTDAVNDDMLSEARQRREPNATPGKNASAEVEKPELTGSNADFNFFRGLLTALALAALLYLACFVLYLL